MRHDVVVVGAGPVGSTLALALAAGGIDVIVLDGRAAGETPRGDRSLALSHGARLILERVGVWDALSVAPERVDADRRASTFRRPAVSDKCSSRRTSTAFRRWATSSAIARCRRRSMPRSSDAV